jgi:beta-N-acetylhexosaminidase
LTKIPGVRLLITDIRDFRPVETGIHLVAAFYDMLAEDEQNTFFRRPGFDSLAGTASLRQSIEAGEETAEIIASWRTGIGSFGEQRRKYLLY